MFTTSLLTGLLVLATAAHAGPLDPPGGPVGSTMKTLDQVEPRIPINQETCPGDDHAIFIVSAPGSYYLTGNVTGAAGTRGIQITSGDVTIDLAGYRLVGGAGSFDGVELIGSHRNVVVKNGTVSNWASSGVNLFTGAGCRVSNVTVASNGGTGIKGGLSTTIESCASMLNLGSGYSLSAGGVASNCTAVKNGGAGFYLYAGSTAEHCASEENGTSGFSVSHGAVVRGCTASGNQQHGFWLQFDAQALDCLASYSGQAGFYADGAVQISRCSAVRNAGDGISAGDDGSITDNQCRSNGYGEGKMGAGIHVRASCRRTLVRGNNVASNDWGILVDTGFNLIIGNTCTTNGVNFEIVSGNRVGTISVLPFSGAISGNAGGDSAGADPIANFAF